MNIKVIIDKLYEEGNLTDKELKELICSGEQAEYLAQMADKKRQQIYGRDIYVRGLIELTNYCKNDCYYCGIRRSNKEAVRYRLTKEQVLSACENGFENGFRTFVLQGGEDPYFTDERICEIVSEIREKFPECAITLSIGEKSRESYQKYFDEGANRYLLRHETATDELYRRLHPEEMSLESRKECLFNLKEIGYQVGAGFMVGAPYQTIENLIDDLRFMQMLQPEMIGIGPFISQKDTPFKDEKNGSLELTLRLLSVLRLMFPHALIPATTSLGTIHPEGREMGFKAGANVVMPNLSPVEVRAKYLLYDNKIYTDDDAAACRSEVERRAKSAGYQIVTDRGDAKKK